MASRSKYTFVTLKEFVQWLAVIVNELDADVVLYRGPDVRLKKWDGRPESFLGIKRVYFTDTHVNLDNIRNDDLSTGMLAWVQIDLPRTNGTRLLASQVATKSDWFDAARQTVVDNPAALRLFDRFWSKWKKHLMFPVWAKNRITGAEAPYRSIGYSEAAAEWFLRGRQLCQDGVDNIEFIIRTVSPSCSLKPGV